VKASFFVTKGTRSSSWYGAQGEAPWMDRRATAGAARRRTRGVRGGGVRDVLGCVRPGEGTSPRNGAGGARKPRVAGSPRRGTRGRAWPARRRGTASFLAQTF
jgi:hypothetical protein